MFQRMPESLRRWPMTALQKASTGAGADEHAAIAEVGIADAGALVLK
jgi:hypothetical protein